MANEQWFTRMDDGGVVRVTTSGPFSLVVNNQPILTFKTDGSVEFGPSVTPDEAAREFWALVASANPLRAEVEHLKAENAAMREIVQAVADGSVLEGYHDSTGNICNACGALVDSEPHKLQCINTKARQLLDE